MDKVQGDTDVHFMKCAGELDPASQQYKVSQKESMLTMRRVQNGCWNGYHMRSALVVIYNCKPKILIAFLSNDNARVWDYRRSEHRVKSYVKASYWHFESGKLEF